MNAKSCIFHGNIGCGKSSWMKQLFLLGYNTVFEDISDIAYLNDYWKKVLDVQKILMYLRKILNY